MLNGITGVCVMNLMPMLVANPYWGELKSSHNA